MPLRVPCGGQATLGHGFAVADDWIVEAGVVYTIVNLDDDVERPLSSRRVCDDLCRLNRIGQPVRGEL